MAVFADDRQYFPFLILLFDQKRFDGGIHLKNRPWVILLGLLLCLFIAPCPAKADAFETLPAEVQQLFLSEYSQEDVADTLTFSLANGQTCCMILNHFGWLYGYFPQADGYVLNYCNSNLANVGTESLQLARHLHLAFSRTEAPIRKHPDSIFGTARAAA